MLPLCFGEATKTAGLMLDADKTYRATARLGQATDSGDIDGAVIRECSVPALDDTRIRETLANFLGPIEQVPPMYSALKHQGRPLYALARQGITVERKPRPVTIHALELNSWSAPLLEFEVRCSKGTYVRTLAEDIAARLGTCAHLTALRRLSVGLFRERDMLSLQEVERLASQAGLERTLLPVDAGLSHWPVVRLAADAEARFRHGNTVEASQEAAETGVVRVYGLSGQCLGLGEVSRTGQVRPLRVFNLCPD